MVLVGLALLSWSGRPPATPPNVVLLIGDGMGLAQISAVYIDRPADFVFDRFPVIGLQKTSSADNLVTDSAAAATAMATGVKTYNSAVGLGPDSARLTNLVELAAANDYATGLVATSSLTHATPAAFAAHARLRGMVEGIAADLSTSSLDLLIGGGQRAFERRYDGRNLLDTLRVRGFRVYPTGSRPLRKLDPTTDERLAYFTADQEPVSVREGRRYLPTAATLAMQRLAARRRAGYFLLVEGSQIDWAGHQNDGPTLLAELHDFQRTVARVLDLARKQGNTLVIVTADHETGGLGIGEQSRMGAPRLAFSSKKHTGTVVPVFAAGPGAERFAGIYENTAIFDKLVEVLGW